MVLQRWDPLFDFRRAMNRHWRDTRLARVDNEQREWAIPVDVVDEENELLVRASIPGVKVDDIDVSIENRVLTIKAETKSETEHEEGGY